MCACGINEPCYGCPCGCYHNPEYLAEHERYSESRRAIYRVRKLHKPSSNGDYCTHCEIGQVSGYDYADYPCDTIKALDGEK